MELASLRPSVRVAHYYRFPEELNPLEQMRIGYCYALHLVDGGKGSLRARNRVYPLRSGDLVYLPPSLPHSFYSEPLSPLSTYNVYGELWTDRPLATAEHLVWDEMRFDESLLTPVELCPELDELPLVSALQLDSALAQILMHLVRKFEFDKRPSTEAITGSLLKAFLIELALFPERQRHVDFRIRPIVERIEQEARNGGSYAEWLAECGLKKTQFHSLFKQATGWSPKAYWTRSVMKRAAAALRESRLSVTAIAEHLGYSSIHHFTKQFTRFHGVSPSEYRKRMN
ncbi:helix-turn-helix domain-containing protein [Cohnella zeiphila]|uniref:Helix-turn-helix transcriptional regulator n=1 Tax=Cohnella zeiphila TaxID=2761120 RepID=A0A7X0VTR8_9BACL|nr:AraC family transcriptional regulator [Cohnella zeiphila]MBB6729457.1 helix-turn-helix transcriptional regulator [Cohnella zeiphila]